MPTDRVNLPSVAYWRGGRQPQRFYVAFCLLMSSIQDSLLGLKEQGSANLNWSATCSYYALVHAGRLLTFIALGDYPKSHAELRRVVGITGQHPRRRPRARDGFPFDWLRGFSVEASPGSPQNEPSAAPPSAGGSIDLREALVQYWTDTGVERAAERLNRFGAVLEAAGELRNDSNYEALLIAHEYEHVTMTSAFECLARDMAAAADSNLPFVAEAFTRFLRADPDLEPDRGGYSAFARDYLEDRLVLAVDRKLGGYQDLKKKLRATVARIDVPSTGIDYHDLEHKVSLDIFGGKARLMGAFQGRIEELRRATGNQVV